MGNYHNDSAANLESQLKHLPAQTGVYFFKDESGQIIYIGKAKSIASRVKSHFARRDRRGQEMIARACQIDFLVLDNETEALVAEQNLIKQHQPRYNVLLKDDHSYPWIALSIDQEYPRLYLTREKHVQGRRYFGPYPSARQAAQLVDLLNRIFLLRSCQGNKPGRHTGSPCLDYHIGRCSAPCFRGGKNKQAYQEDAVAALKCLQGGYQALSRKLQAEMKSAASKQQYERAARYRDLLQDLEKITAHQRVAGLGNRSCDLVACSSNDGDHNIQLWRIRQGILEAKLGFYLQGDNQPEVVSAFLEQYYQDAAMVPAEILVSQDLLDHPLLGEAQSSLNVLRCAAVKLKAPGGGKRGSLWKTAQRNAQLALQRESLDREFKRQRTETELVALKDALGMDHLPARIECYDASHLMGTHTYVSMVVLQDGQPLAEHYRVFKIESQAGSPDDFWSLQNALERRLQRLVLDLSPHDPKWDKSFSQTPDLILVDGGLGQLHAAREALKGWDNISLAALAKKEEEVYLAAIPEPLCLPDDHPGLQVLQRARDEAHRFALKHHRQSRDQQQTRSLLDGLQGIGAARKKMLLEKFGSVQKISKASLSELAEVLPSKLAESVYQQMNNKK